MAFLRAFPTFVCAFCVIYAFGLETNGEADKPKVTPKVDGAAEAVTMHICPNFCTVGIQILCWPPPCPPPACVDPAKYKPTDCCEYCPNGPDCRAPDGSIVLYKHWKIVGGKNCTCINIMGPTTCT